MSKEMQRREKSSSLNYKCVNEIFKNRGKNKEDSYIKKKEYKKDKRKQEIIQGGIRMWKKGRKNKTENKAEFYLFNNFKKPGLCLTIEIVFM